MTREPDARAEVHRIRQYVDPKLTRNLDITQDVQYEERSYEDTEGR
jgi:hypothetical protein